jgi:FAD:protein FMN transferase
MFKKYKLVALSLSITALLLSGCTRNVEPTSRQQIVLGTVGRITVHDKVNPEILDQAFKAIAEIENKMTITAEDSEVIRVNNAAGRDFVPVSDETFYVVKEGVRFSDLSDGRFDITIGPLVQLWGIGSDNPRLPSEKEINERLPLINYRNIQLDEDNKQIKLTVPGMVMDLGGIAKGHAADEVRKFLLDNGIKHALINLGGDIWAMNTRPDGSPWRIGIQNPDTTRGAYMGILDVTNQTVVTSGIYERFFHKDGRDYHHIFSTEDGYPVENSLASLSIITDSAIAADALSTAVFAMGLEEGMRFVNNLEGVEAIFITRDSGVYLTSGIKDSFRLTDNSFELRN